MASQEIPTDGHLQTRDVASLIDKPKWHHILQTLKMADWVKREAARVLGINRSTLDRKLERLGRGAPRCSS